MNLDTAREQSPGNFTKLLKNPGFEAFLWTQLLGAFNDNVYKMMVSMLAVSVAASQQVGARYLAVAGAVFVLPFLLFSGTAGELADRFSKTRVLQITKALEIATMLLGLGALLLHQVEWLLGVLFLLAMQATFFSPAKYGILPEMVEEVELSAANGLVEFSTLAAIVLGTSFGSFLIATWSNQPWKLGGTLLAIAVAGSLTSWRIPYVEPSGSRERVRLNPFGDVWVGLKKLGRNRPLALTIVGLSYFWFAGALFQMAVLLFGKERLHQNDLQIGLLATALALGIASGSVGAGLLSRDQIELGLAPAGLFFLGLSSIGLSLTYSYAWSVAWLFLIGFSGGLFFIPLNAFLQERAGKQEKGRMMATNNFANMSGIVLASGLLSLLHDQLGWAASKIIGALGVLTIAATVYVVYILRDLTLRLSLSMLVRLYFRIRVVGRENIPLQSGALLVANHVSFADAVLIGSCTRRIIRFLMWKPYFDLKIAKPFFHALAAIPIDPTSPKEILRALRRASGELSAGELVCIFPEGGLTRTGQVQPFQRGVDHLIGSAPSIPVIPIYLDGLWGHPLSAAGNRSAAAWLRSWRRQVTIYVGPAVSGDTSAAALRDRVVELGALIENAASQASFTGRSSNKHVKRMGALLGIALLALSISGCSAYRRPAALTDSERMSLRRAPLPFSVVTKQWTQGTAANTGQAALPYAHALAKTVSRSGAFQKSWLEDAAPAKQTDLIAVPTGSYCNSAVIPIFTLLSLGIFPTVFDDEDCVGLRLLPASAPSGKPVRIEFSYKGKVVLGWAAVFVGFMPGWKHGSARDDPRFDEHFRLQVLKNEARIKALTGK